MKKGMKKIIKKFNSEKVSASEAETFSDSKTEYINLSHKNEQ